MQTTLSIDDDILAVAKHLAERESKSIGEVVSALARQGLNRSAGKAPAVRNGIPLLARQKSAVAVTPELVNQLRDELP
jgi:hypothetical protein